MNVSVAEEPELALRLSDSLVPMQMHQQMVQVPVNVTKDFTVLIL